MKFFYVYILQSENIAGHFYTGFTEDLQERLKTHNAGNVPHTAKCVGGPKLSFSGYVSSSQISLPVQPIKGG